MNAPTALDTTELRVESLCAAYGNTPVLREVNLHLPRGAIGTLIGPSGSGKTTLLRVLAGFEAPTAGSVALEGRRIADASFQLPPEQRNFAMAFQDLALLPHLSALDNVRFALHKLPRNEARTRALEALEMMQLADHADKKPHQMSGGQQQRVALARALAFRPRLLLMDEPLSSLDEELRQKMRGVLHEHIKRLGITALIVTHGQHEAYALGDWVGVLNDGALLQWDSPYNLYHRPASRFVADFVGEGVFIRGERAPEAPVINTEFGPLRPSLPIAGNGSGKVELLLRPDDVLHDDDSPWQGQILRKEFRGAEFLYEVALPSGTRLLSLVPSHHNHRVGEAIGIRLNLEHVIAFPVTDQSAA